MRSHSTATQESPRAATKIQGSEKKKTKTKNLRAGVRQVLWYKPSPCTRYLEIQEPSDENMEQESTQD